MASDLQHEGLDFCKTVFETVRQMSAEGRGVTRQGGTDLLNAKSSSI